MYRQRESLLTTSELESGCRASYASPLGVVKTPTLVAKTSEGEDGGPERDIFAGHLPEGFRALPRDCRLLLKAESLQGGWGARKERQIVSQDKIHMLMLDRFSIVTLEPPQD